MSQTDKEQLPSVKQTVANTASSTHKPHKAPTVPRWTVIISIIALGLLYAALTSQRSFGPSWLPLALEIALMIPIIIPWLIGRPLPHVAIRTLAFLTLGVATLALISGIVLLIITLPQTDTSKAGNLLRDAALLWISNVLVFGLWYWELDGGGPVKRHQAGHQAADLMFPQQVDGNTRGWAPDFLDYVFVAFTASTALSPTDTYPLTRTAKGLMMVQAIISLVIIILLAARAVNIL